MDNASVSKDEIYTPLEEARDEIYRRWADRDLRRRVEEFHGGVPPCVKGEPRAYLARTVGTPNRELHRFIELANETGLAPVILEHLDDRFCSMNADKRGLVSMTFFKGHNRNGEPIFQRRTITSGNVNGKQFTSLVTLWGENLIAFHRRILQSLFPNMIPENESSWIRSNGATPREFYPAHLARFLCYGIFFENFLQTRVEVNFTRDIVLPAFKTVFSLFGIQPLVVRLLPEESEDDPSWSWYDAGVENFVTNELQSIPSRQSR